MLSLPISDDSRLDADDDVSTLNGGDLASLTNGSEEGQSSTETVVTRIEKHRAFYPAEDYHQDYMVHNPYSGYIMRFDQPKVEAFKAMFPRDYRDDFLRDGPKG